MKRIRQTLYLTGLLMLVWSSTSRGQIFEFPPSQPLELHKPLEENARRMQRSAMLLENRGDSRGALGLYKTLFSQYPEYDPFYEGMIRCWIATEGYAEGLAVTDSLRKALTDHVSIANLTQTEQERLASLIVDGGRLVGRLGRREEAFQRWDELYALPHPSVNAFFRLMAAMIDCRYPDGLEDMATRARRATGDPTLLAFSLASYWAERGQADRAIEELLRLMELQPRQAESIQRQILSLPDNDQARQQVEATLLAAKSRTILKKEVVQLLSQFYFHNREWEKAYEAVREADRLGGSSGQEMLNFAETLNTENESKLAWQVLADMVKSHPDIAALPRTILAQGSALEAQGAYLQADSVYQRMTQAGGLRSVQEQEALLRQARLKLENLRQPEAARTLLNEGLKRNPRLIQGGQVKLLIGDSYLVQQNLTEALKTYLDATTGAFGGDPVVRSEALVNAARVEVLLGRISQAQQRLEEATHNNPEGLLTNDGLELLELLREGLSDSLLLVQLFHADLYAKQGNDSEAESLYNDVAEKTQNPTLGEQALWKLAEHRRNQKRPQDALQALEEALKRFPKSLRAAEFLLQMGIIYEGELGEPQKAMQIYERILVDYPQSLPVPEARKRIRELEPGQS